MLEQSFRHIDAEIMVNSVNKQAVVVPSSLLWMKYAVVALDSYVSTSIDRGTDFCLLVPEESLTQAKAILSSAKITFPILLRGFPQSVLEDYPITSRWGEVSWYRTIIPSLPEWNYYDKILLLGADVFCLSFDIDLFGFDPASTIMAVKEPYTSPTYGFFPFNLAGSRYFNADVLLYDCAKWRSNYDGLRIQQLVLNLERELPFADQDVMNLYFYDSWCELPPHFNWIPSLNSAASLPSGLGTFIIQWAGKSKPWDGPLIPPFKTTRQWRLRYQEIWADLPRELFPQQKLGFSFPFLPVLYFYFPRLTPLIYFSRRKAKTVLRKFLKL